MLRDAIVESALRSAELAEATGLGSDRIILSAKVSDVPELIAVYRQLSPLSDYPLHLGLTEAGMGTKGTVATAAALSVLLIERDRRHDPGLAHPPGPGATRTEEVRVARQILQSLQIRELRAAGHLLPGVRPDDLDLTSRRWPRRSRDISGSGCPPGRTIFPGSRNSRSP